MKCGWAGLSTDRHTDTNMNKKKQKTKYKVVNGQNGSSFGQHLDH